MLLGRSGPLRAHDVPWRVLLTVRPQAELARALSLASRQRRHVARLQAAAGPGLEGGAPGGGEAAAGGGAGGTGGGGGGVWLRSPIEELERQVLGRRCAVQLRVLVRG